ncbi:MAG: hypothetical protein KA771_04285 [Spirochaetales bacterium]|nr:hypothetical protein [Spirochaetales bacterium]
MKLYLRTKVLAVLIVGLFVGGIYLSQALGWWSTVSRKVARTIASGEFAGNADPADIRGSYTFSDIQKNFGIPVEVLAKAFGFEKEPDPASIQAKMIEEQYGEIDGKDIGTDSVRLFVSLYTGIPHASPEEGTGILETAFQVLKEAGKLSPDQEKELLPKVVKVPGDKTTTPPALPAAPAVAPEKSPDSGTAGGTPSTEVLIKGKTTFKEVLAWGVTKAQIEKVLGRPMPAEGTIIKDWCTSEGLEFGTIRDALQRLRP